MNKVGAVGAAHLAFGYLIGPFITPCPPIQAPAPFPNSMGVGGGGQLRQQPSSRGHAQPFCSHPFVEGAGEGGWWPGWMQAERLGDGLGGRELVEGGGNHQGEPSRGEGAPI